jgi:succinate-semialdehyde dehydrogenase / glutarate-semialdehyde dehydrogenase
MSCQSVNPFSNRFGKSFEKITDQQLEEKIAAAACFTTWKQTSYAERSKIVNKSAKLLHEQAD